MHIRLTKEFHELLTKKAKELKVTKTELASRIIETVLGDPKTKFEV